MPEIELLAGGGKRISFALEEAPSNPAGIAEMSEEDLEAEHQRRVAADPTFEPGRAPNTRLFHDEISAEGELDALWGKRWGAQGIGKLREVMLTRPPVNETREAFYRDPEAYMEKWTAGKPDVDKWQEQYETMKANYEAAGVIVNEVVVPDAVLGPYGFTRWFWAGTDAGVVLNGGAIVPRGGWFGAQKGREPVWQKALALLGVPIIYGVRGFGVAELGGQVWLDNHHFLVSDGTVMNPEGARQVKQIFEMSDAKLVCFPTPGFYQEVEYPAGGTGHVDLVCGIPDKAVVVLAPAFTSYSTVKFFQRLGYRIIEVPMDEHRSGVCNMVALEPGTVMCPTLGASRTIKALEDAGIEIVPTETTESLKAGGGVHCSTCQLRRDVGPFCEALLEKPLERQAPELVVRDWHKDWSRPTWDWGYSIERLDPAAPRSG